MPLPSFTVTGTLFDILGDTASSELVATGAASTTITFTPNIALNQAVEWAGDLYRVRPVTGVLNGTGITRSGSPVELLANDAGLNVTGIQWEVKISTPGLPRALTFWFDAPADGVTVDLAAVAPVPNAAVNPVGGLTETALLGLLGEDGSGVRDALDDLYAASGPYYVDAIAAGVVPNGVTNNGPLIQSLLEALPEGGTLFLPPGNYGTNQTIKIPPKRQLLGADNSRWNYTSFAKTFISALTPFTGNAIIKVADQTVSGYATASNGVHLKNLTTVGYALPWTDGSGTETVHGFMFEGLVRSITLDNLTAVSSRGNGFRFTAGASTQGLPRGIEATRLRSCDANRKEHFYLAGTSDSIFTDCLATAGNSHGFYLLNCGETKLIGCRAVFTAGHGFWLDGTPLTSGLGGTQLIGPSTDRNAWSGIYISATDTSPIVITGPLLRRDGSASVHAGTIYPALQILGTSGTKASPVIVEGLGMNTGKNDDNTGTETPLVGVSVQYGSSIQIAGSSWAVETPVVDNGGHTLDPVLPGHRRTGPKSSFTDAYVSPSIAPGTHAATSKTTPVDADELPLVDSAASNVLKKLTWANLKAALANISTSQLGTDVQSALDYIPNSLITMSRGEISANTITLTSGVLMCTYFVANQSITVANVNTFTGTVAAAATPTICRIGLFSVDPSTGALTLIASTANDTTLWAATFTKYTKAFSSSVAVTKGSKYAVGLLCVTAAAAPRTLGNGIGFAAEFGVAPRWVGQLTGQTDLPVSAVTDVSLSNNAPIYVRLTT